MSKWGWGSTKACAGRGQATDGVTWRLSTQKSSGPRQHEGRGQASRPSVSDPRHHGPAGPGLASPLLRRAEVQRGRPG